MPRYIYRSDATGNVNAVLVSRVPYEGTPAECVTDFQQTVLNTYRKIEEQGKWPRNHFSKDTVKRVHETALERDRYKKQ